MRKSYTEDGCVKLDLDADPDGHYFNFVVDYLIYVLKATLKNRLATEIMDQVYFDFQYEDNEFTLFFDDVMGLFLIALTKESNKFLEELDLSEIEYSKYLKTHSKGN